MKYRDRDPLASFVAVYANDIDAYIPEFWAQEGLVLLEENMIAANLVHRDFENVLSRYGDVVNIRKPGQLEAIRKTDCEDVTVQDVSASSVQVTLNQHVHTSFLICDGQESMSDTDLIEEFLRPAMIAQARFVDHMVLGQYVQFLDGAVGELLGLDSTNAKSYLLAMRKLLNDRLIPFDSRLGILNTATETEFLNLPEFTQAQMVGDQGNALANATLGRKYGMDLWTAQNMPTVLATNTARTGTVDTGGAAIGDTTIPIAGITGALLVGSWISIDGLPYRVAGSTGGATPTAVTINAPGLSRAVAAGAPVRVVTPAAVNQVGGYPAGYMKEIAIDTTTVSPQVGQAVSFGTDPTSPIYSVLKATTTFVLLDRPLEEDLADNEAVNLGPAGNFSFFFTKNAIALVIRPLALPKAGTGALATTLNANSLSLRVVITYDGRKQGHLVTLDFLAGIKVLDKTLGAVLLG
jgi:coat protein Gp5